MFFHKMLICHEWFLGKNDLGVPLYDAETKGCCDGLEPDGVNRNQGAESTLAYLISHMTVVMAIESKTRPVTHAKVAGKTKTGKERIILE